MSAQIYAERVALRIAGRFVNESTDVRAQVAEFFEQLGDPYIAGLAHALRHAIPNAPAPTVETFN